MIVTLLAPRLGEGVEEMTVVKWLKNPGDTLQEYEPLVEVETDKVITEIPSPAEGILARILVLPDSRVAVGTPLAEIEKPGGEPQQPSPAPIQAAAAPKAVQPPAAPEPAARPSKAWISPLVRKMAAEHSLDLATLHGSGMGGRITKQDVLAHLAARPTQPAAPAAPPPAAPSPAPAPRPGIQSLSSMRRQIAERMLQSVRTAPHVLTVMEADMSRVLAHQARNRPAFATQGLRLTLTAYIASALASSLRANPLVNSSWVEGGIQVHPHIHIGMAVSLGGEGLIVPVIRDADSLSLVGMARAVNDLAERARSGKLQAHEVRDGTFTLTNHGVGGSLFAMPIINQPQTGILGVGALHKRPIVISDQDGNDALAIRPMVYLSLVFDHRVLDGASADQFLAAVKAHLETPAF